MSTVSELRDKLAPESNRTITKCAAGALAISILFGGGLAVSAQSSAGTVQSGGATANQFISKFQYERMPLTDQNLIMPAALKDPAVPGSIFRASVGSVVKTESSDPGTVRQTLKDGTVITFDRGFLLGATGYRNVKRVDPDGTTYQSELGVLPTFLTFRWAPIVESDPDGSTRNFTVDGTNLAVMSSRDVTYSDLASGTLIKKFPNGDIQETRRGGTSGTWSGTSVLQTAAGTRIQTNADGTKIEELKDGRIIVTKPSGEITTYESDDNYIQRPDGTETLIVKDGTKIDADAKGVSTITAPDGKTSVEAPTTVMKLDGTKIEVIATGHSWIYYKDGSRVEERPDKTVVTYDTDGSVTTAYNTGVTVKHGADGTTTRKFPDKTTWTRSPDGTIVQVQPDGTTYTRQPDGTVLQKNPDGTSMKYETDGTAVSTNTSGGTESFEYDPNVSPIPDAENELVPAGDLGTSMPN